VHKEGTFTLALLLAALAGWVDAAGLSVSAHLFLSFMSGNTTDLAVAVARRDWSHAATIAAIVALFVAGVGFGELIAPLAGRRGTCLVLTIEAIILAAGAALHAPGVSIPGLNPLFPLVFAMGLQNATMQHVGGISLSLTYVTGTLVQIGRGLAALLTGKGNIRSLTRYLALWLSLATGAGLGTLALSLSPLAALATASFIAALLAAMTARR
jgi:uncharacterized membrane protein YoaK (UPF0700 family)